MNLLPKSGLHRQLIFYTVFIGIIFLTMAIEMTVFLHGDRVLGVLNSVGGSGPVSETVKLVQLKMGVMLGILLFGIGLVMLLFTKRIMFPLSRIIEGTRAMSDGNFSVTLPDQGHDELGELARKINDLTANHQELILLVGNMCGQLREELGPCQAQGEGEGAARVLDELEETLGEFGRSFYR
ncbi:MAG: HAMP domain-containing protein [Thermodesulfobacteriota bacterium]